MTEKPTRREASHPEVESVYAHALNHSSYEEVQELRKRNAEAMAEGDLNEKCLQLIGSKNKKRICGATYLACAPIIFCSERPCGLGTAPGKMK